MNMSPSHGSHGELLTSHQHYLAEIFPTHQSRSAQISVIRLSKIRIPERNRIIKEQSMPPTRTSESLTASLTIS